MPVGGEGRVLFCDRLPKAGWPMPRKRTTAPRDARCAPRFGNRIAAALGDQRTRAVLRRARGALTQGAGGTRRDLDRRGRSALAPEFRCRVRRRAAPARCPSCCCCPTRRRVGSSRSCRGLAGRRGVDGLVRSATAPAGRRQARRIETNRDLHPPGVRTDGPRRRLLASAPTSSSPGSARSAICD
jgi:hypothetical protein